ncbi:MAG: DNA-binding response regulator [Planctomycetes bacterium]|jgi:DNA-binding response OmpR family regulator|nr:DNA-binding response regulator [Planctomycetota bacterium]MDP6410646.1 response regulator transcription factor [Planctomycetota bacterium]
MGPRRLLVVEDDQDLREVLVEFLRREGYEVSEAADGEAGLEAVRAERPDLVCLDVMMPGLDGIEVCRRLRADADFADLPILMLSAKGDESDVVLGLGVGADDYVTKPARPKELHARVRSLLRRKETSGRAPSRSVVRAGDLEVDEERFEVRAAGAIVRLTPTEFRILQIMARRPGRVYRRADLLELATPGGGFVEERTIDVHIRAIRAKLGERADWVETVRGIGYRFRDEAG